MELSQLQKAACEGVWRALRERNVNRTDRHLTQNTPEPKARQIIADYVSSLPIYSLPNHILPDMNKYGTPRSGYTRQWSGICEAGIRHDAHVAQQAAQRSGQRMSEMQNLPDVSDSSGTLSKEHSAAGKSEYGDSTDNDKTPNEDSGDTRRLHCGSAG